MSSTTMRAVVLGAALTAVIGTLVPAHAHTDVVIAGFQIVPGGYVSVPAGGPVPVPALDAVVDGTVRWTNLDPVPHRLVECAQPCGANPQPRANPRINFTVPAGEIRVVNVDALLQGDHNRFLAGRSYRCIPGQQHQTIEYFDRDYPWMRGQIRFGSVPHC